MININSSIVRSVCAVLIISSSSNYSVAAVSSQRVRPLLDVRLIDRSNDFVPVAVRPTAASEGISIHEEKVRVSAVAAVRSAFERSLPMLTHADAAMAAMSDVLSFLRRAKFAEVPFIGMDEEGPITLEWQIGEGGWVVVFTGDGTFAASHCASANDMYVGNQREFALAETVRFSIS